MTGSPVASAAAVSPSAVSRWSTLNAATAALLAGAARRSAAVLARLMAAPRVGWVSGRWSRCRESRRACRDRVKGVVRQTRGRAEHEILCEHGCAEQASVIGKGSQKQRWATVEAEQPIKLLREWREQRVTGSCAPAAEHDRVGCDNGNERGERASARPDSVTPHQCCDLITTGRCRQHVPGTRDRMARQRLVAPGDRARGGDGFEASHGPAGTVFAVGVALGVADLAREPAAKVELRVEHECTGESGADCENDNAVVPARRSQSLFCQSGGPHVVAEGDRQAEGYLRERLHRRVAPSQGCRKVGDARALSDESGNAEAHCRGSNTVSSLIVLRDVGDLSNNIARWVVAAGGCGVP